MEPRAPLHESSLRALLLSPAGPVPRLVVAASTGSTIADVLADPAAWPDGALLVADHQTAGRGRLDRTWQVPARAALTCTYVVRLGPDEADGGWLPLLAGLSVVRALRATAGVPAALKWPNDVLVDVPGAPQLPVWGTVRKVAGILCQQVGTPTGPLVAVGIGLNVAQTDDELPVPSATSLALAGAAELDREVLLVALVAALAQICGRWREAAGQVQASGLAAEVAQVCATLGEQVRIERPDGTVLLGRAVRLAEDGALVVEADDGGEVVVHTGDVTHLRRS